MTEIDPYRLAVAVHELGHLIAWQRAGLHINEIRVFGTGERAEGYVDLGRQRIRDTDQARAYLVGLLTGREAEVRWCELSGMRHHDYTSEPDMRSFRRLRRHKLARHLTDAELRHDARALVRAQWEQITRLAPRLARCGWLPL
ncbi:hypothetical protein [Lentzea aerocolonigenes]|uniref:hypothetical protein n=1 Tax=Lentzea aerocolonigenes TaxID=68170 RepID=UPI0004C2D8EF|nr:hypothetical protein [Lentzea aerocolonigenes]MCP2242728.1 hypothetical protein [Lentzea aerocolonigenes]